MSLVSVVSVHAVLKHCTALGIDTQHILDTFDVSSETIADPDARISSDLLIPIWQKAYELCHDPFLVLRVAQGVPIGAYRVVDYLTLSSKSLEDAFTQLSRYFRLIDEGTKIEIHVSPESIEIELCVDGVEPSNVIRECLEYTWVALIYRTRKMFDWEYPLKRMDFACDAPPDDSEHRRIFGCELRWNSPKNMVVLDIPTWSQSNIKQDQHLFDTMRNYADLLWNQRGYETPETVSFRNQVQEVIMECLPRGDVNLKTVAAKLRFSERTLQRRLKEEQTTFAEIVQCAQRVSAQTLLKNPSISIADVAFLVGFADQSSFTRAFRRWHSMPPGEFRRRCI